MSFTQFGPPAAGAGFEIVAGRERGLTRLMVVAGRLAHGAVGPVHVHEGDEVLRIVSGELTVRCGRDQRVCGPDEVVVIPPGTPHGFTALSDVVLEVVAEYDIGTLYPVRSAAGPVELVEVHRADMPWGRPPPAGTGWTSDEEMQRVLDSLADEF